jgi:hypothetical protein
MSKWVKNCRKEKYDVYIGRPSKWGNPYSIGKDGTREEVIYKHHCDFFGKPQLMIEAIKELKGKTLGCYCSPAACHGDTLSDWANREGRYANRPLYSFEDGYDKVIPAMRMSERYEVVKEEKVKKEGIVLAIVGSRGFTNYGLVKEKMAKFIKDVGPVSKIVSGGANGADSLGVKWAQENKVDYHVHRPDWNKYGNSAGYKRNELIVADADMVLAFWDGQSKGTKHTLDIAKEAGKKRYVVRYEPINKVEL